MPRYTRCRVGRGEQNWTGYFLTWYHPVGWVGGWDFDGAGSWIKRTVPQDFRLQVFSWISFPQAPEYTVRAILNFFQKIWKEIHSSRCTSGVIDTSGTRKKMSIRKVWFYFVTPLGSRVNIKIHFFLQAHLKVSAIWCCWSHYLSPVSLTPVVSTTHRYWRKSLQPVSLIPGQIATAPRIVEKIWYDPNVIFRGLGETWKNLKQKWKISWHYPFNDQNFKKLLRRRALMPQHFTSLEHRRYSPHFLLRSEQLFL